MRLPYLSDAPTRKRQQIIEFGGINYGEGARDGELAESTNLRADLYPCISPSLGKNDCGTFDGAEGVLGGDDLFVAAGGKLYRNGEEIAQLSPGEKTLLKMSTKLIVFPDKVYINLKDEDNYELTKGEPSDWEEEYASYYTKNEGTGEFEVVSGVSAPVWVPERYYKYIPVHELGASFEFSGSTLAFEKNKIRLLAESGYCLKNKGLYKTTAYDKVYISKAISFDNSSGKLDMGSMPETFFQKSVLLLEEGTRVKYTEGFCVIEKILEKKEKIMSNGSDSATYEVRVFTPAPFEYTFKEGFCDLFKPGDSVKISGCYMNKENNMTLVVRDVTPSELIFDEDVFIANVDGHEVGAVTIEREVPDFDVVCEHNNRIWGADKEKIYSSALGDPTNFNIFEGLASDSFSVAVASDGDFTGCVGFSGSVLFFKEDLMYKILGDYPANYMLTEYNVAGVKKGSSRSLANINERLFYHSNDGIYTYSGSVPTCISYNFGTRRYENASGGGFGTKYYVSALDTESGKYELFVYDTIRGMWLRAEELEVKYFSENDGKYMMLTGDGKLLQAEVEKTPADAEWSAELCEMTEYINERKCYSKLYMRLDLGEGAYVKAEIRCDRGLWKTVWESTPKSEYTANIVFKPTRCDRFSIRLSGRGEAVIRSLIREYEVGSEV